MRTRIEGNVPVEELYGLAIKEGNAKKPVYQMHKWWARRLGSIFRMLLLLSTAPYNQTDQELWDRYYKGDNLSHLKLLDTFMGGGTSILEATKLGISTIGVDIDPVAWFVTRQEVRLGNRSKIEATLNELENSEVVAQIKRLYQTTVSVESLFGTQELADVVYNFWVELIECTNCKLIFEAHNHYKLAQNNDKNIKIVFCKDCHKIHTVGKQQVELICDGCSNITDIEKGPIYRGQFTCPSCDYKGRILDTIEEGMPLNKRLFAIQYIDPQTRTKRWKKADEADIELYKQAESLFQAFETTLSIPTRHIPIDERHDMRPVSHGYSYYHQLFNPRQLLSLGLILNWIKEIRDPEVKDYFYLAFSDSLASNNWFCRYAYDYDKLTPLFGLHAYTVVNRPVENNVWGTDFGRGSFSACLRKVLRGLEYSERPYESRYQLNGTLERVYIDSPIHATVFTDVEEWNQSLHKGSKIPSALLLNQSSSCLAQIEDKSLDILLSDPPYYDNLAYSELSDFYYAWIQSHLSDIGAKWTETTTPYTTTLFINKQRTQSQEINDFISNISNIFREGARVLKDEGIFVFTFHHLDAPAWLPLILALKDADFQISNVFPVRSEGKSGFHSSDGTIKWDVVLVCRKVMRVNVLPNLESSEDETISDIARRSYALTQAWATRLQQNNIAFGWPDQISLNYAFLALYISHLSIDYLKNCHVPSYYAQLSEAAISLYPKEVRDRLKNRNRFR